MEETQEALHIVVFPWLAFGHMTFLDLSKRHLRLHADERCRAGRSPAGARSASTRRQARLDLPAVEGIPEGAESTADVPPEKVELLKKAFDGLAVPFERLVTEGCAAAAAGESEPDRIILDFAQNWIWPIAEEHKIACAMLLIFPVGVVGSKQQNEAQPRTTTEEFMVQPLWIPFPTTMTFSRHEAEWIAAAFRPNASGSVRQTTVLPLVPAPVPSHVYLPAWYRVYDRLVKMLRQAYAQIEELIVEREHLITKLQFCRATAASGRRSSRPASIAACGKRSRNSPTAPRGAGERCCPEAEPRLFPLVTDLFTKPVVPAGLLMPEDDDAGGGDDDDGSGFSDAMRWLDEQPKQSVIYVAIGSEAPVDVEVPRDDADGSFRRDAVAAVVRRVMAEDEGVELARNAREMQKGKAGLQEQYVDELVDYLQSYK
ncbi:hypothetical protein BDA96_02G072400 [Sorghum bicolor]|uniref:Uncharacterized protein n=2 Tax=Sorghum bicolor TaxID=4558 RepID=A0A921URY2_SORBI|nr:hypothetical protein BDA96_02G072400 [Sorghum bicolor]OQU88664.1 hypothetical protein SORBI_3002G070901 [Sorghum bicolor]